MLADFVDALRHSISETQAGRTTTSVSNDDTKSEDPDRIVEDGSDYGNSNAGQMQMEMLMEPM